MTFLNKLQDLIGKNNSLVCVGLDTDMNKIPTHLKTVENPLLSFNKNIINATHDLVSCYKFQIAYYSSLGITGIDQLIQSIQYVHSTYPEVPVILDAKRSDIGNTSEQYVKEAFEVFEADAATVNPYLGFDGIEPFLKRHDKGIIILCRTSNTGAKDFQDLKIDSIPLYLKVAEKITEWHAEYQNCVMVVGATYPEDMGKIRSISGDIFFLVPGIGAQGGDLEGVMEHGLRSDKSGLIIHAARSIIYASNGSDFAQKAREETVKLRNQINLYR